MRTILILSMLLAGSASAHEHGNTNHDKQPAAATPVQQTADGAVYGAPLPKTPLVPSTIDAVAADVAAHSGKMAAFSGRITQVCQMKGCWLVLAGENGEFARVSMNEHAFSVPTNASGHAVVYGTLSEEVRSAEEIEHLRKDGAKEPAARELSINAVSVMIGKSA